MQITLPQQIPLYTQLLVTYLTAVNLHPQNRQKERMEYTPRLFVRFISLVYYLITLLNCLPEPREHGAQIKTELDAQLNPDTNLMASQTSGDRRRDSPRQLRRSGEEMSSSPIYDTSTPTGLVSRGMGMHEPEASSTLSFDEIYLPELSAKESQQTLDESGGQNSSNPALFHAQAATFPSTQGIDLQDRNSTHLKTEPSSIRARMHYSRV